MNDKTKHRVKDGMKYRTADDEIVKHILTGKWDEDRTTTRYWFEYADGDVGSLPVNEVRELVNSGEWNIVR